jgi:hypothetical protein
MCRRFFKRQTIFPLTAIFWGWLWLAYHLVLSRNRPQNNPTKEQVTNHCYPPSFASSRQNSQRPVQDPQEMSLHHTRLSDGGWSMSIIIRMRGNYDYDAVKLRQTGVVVCSAKTSQCIGSTHLQYWLSSTNHVKVMMIAEHDEFSWPPKIQYTHP